MPRLHLALVSRFAVAAFAGRALLAFAADASIHSGPLPATPGTGERLVCIVTNVDDKAIDAMRVRIRSLDFGTTISDVQCNNVAPEAACPATFSVSGVPFAAHFACSVDAKGKKDALRGTFYRTSTTGTSDDLAVDLR